MVIEKSDQKPHRRGDIAFDVLWGMKVPKDLLIYTKDEFTPRSEDSSSLCYKVKNEGKVLYARA
jgi:hypothetical protein